MFILPNQRRRRIIRRSSIRTIPGARTFFEVASSDFGFAAGLLQMSTEFVPHRGQELVGKVRLAPRTESLIKRRRENWGRYCFIDRSLNGPASFTRVGDVAGKS